jgi:hypothetical protein
MIILQPPDISSKLISEGVITRDECITLVKKHDPLLDQKSFQAFLDFTGYTDAEFWNVVD